MKQALNRQNEPDWMCEIPNHLKIEYQWRKNEKKNENDCKVSRRSREMDDEKWNK